MLLFLLYNRLKHLRSIPNKKMGSDNDYTANPDMPYDLRQTYAMGILTPILLLIEEHRNKNEFMQWYDVMTMSLHTNINQKLDEDERKEYEEVNKRIVEVLNKYPDAFSCRDKTPMHVSIVKQALKDLEMWLKDKMQKHGLFGSGYFDDEDSL